MDFFSFAIALEDDTLVIGAMTGTFGFGEVHIYKRNANGQFIQERKILGRYYLSIFGGSVDISNGVIAIGAQFEGAAYVWTPS